MSDYPTHKSLKNLLFSRGNSTKLNINKISTIISLLKIHTYTYVHIKHDTNNNNNKKQHRVFLSSIIILYLFRFEQKSNRFYA